MVSLIYLSFRLSSDHTTHLFDLPTTLFPYDMMTAENCFNMVHGCFAISVTTKDIQVSGVGPMERMHSTDRHGQKVSSMPTPLMCPFVWSLIGAKRHRSASISSSSLSACSLAEESTLALGRLLYWAAGSYYLRTTKYYMHLSWKITAILTVVPFRVQICGAGLRHGYYRGETIYERWVNMTIY